MKCICRPSRIQLWAAYNIKVLLLPLCFKVWTKVLIIIYKSLPGIGPGYLTDCLPFVELAWQVQSGKCLDALDPLVKHCHLSGPLKHGFFVAAPTIWNEISPDICVAPTSWHSGKP